MRGMDTGLITDLGPARGHESARGGIVVTASTGRRGSVVRVCGELDTAGTARLAKVCARVTPPRDSSLVLDLEEVTFAGSAAIALLARLESELDEAGVPLVVRPSDQISRLLDMAAD
jgi:anti-anti-sigma factor